MVVARAESNDLMRETDVGISIVLNRLIFT